MNPDLVEFDSIYIENEPKIRRYLTRLVGEKDAEDLTQEVFIRVDQALLSFNHQAKLSTWIYQIATNAAIDRLRSRPFKQETSILYAAETAHKERNKSCETSLSVEDQAIRNEMNDCIQSYICVLPESYKTVLILREIEGFKNSDIAAILNLTLDTVKIRLHRAREKLKKELEANCTFYRTDCNQLACEPKRPFKKINAWPTKKS